MIGGKIMKKRLQGMITGVVIGSIIAGGTVYAKSGTESIQVMYDNIKIFMDGEEVTPKDGNGQSVEPFIYNGTTYLPVRAVSNAIGKEVSWDGVEKVIYLGAKPGNVENWLDVCGPYQYQHGEEYRLSENKYFTMSGKKYTNGFVLEPYSDPVTTGSSKCGFALFNLDGKYNSLTFTVGHIDDTPTTNVTMNVYLDGIIAYTKELKYDDVASKVTIPLNKALQMKIEFCMDGWYYVPSYGFSEGEFK